MNPSATIDRERKVSITLGALWTIIGTVIGGVGASATWVTAARAEVGKLADADIQHVRTLADHEARVRVIESRIIAELATVNVTLNAMNDRLKSLEARR